MRILFSSTPLAGHFGPMVPFARSLLRAGHEVAVAAPRGLESAVAAIGAAYWPLSDPPEDVIGRAFGAMQGMSHDDATQWMAGEIFGRVRTDAAIPGLLRAAGRWRPDIFVRETAEFGGAVAADLLGIPHSRIGIGIGQTEELILRAATPAVSGIRTAKGLSADPDGVHLREAPYFTLFPSGLEDPQSPVPLRTRRFRDPAWRGATEDGPAAPPFVYVTFGSVAAQMEGPSNVFTEAVKAVAPLDVDVLMTVGNGLDIESLGNLPPRLRVERWVDQSAVLTTASAVLCHGGGGTVVGALAAGVPIVAVPLFADDQHINARRVEAAGAGLLAAPQQDAMREALSTLLAQNRYREAAEGLAREMQTHASTDDPSLVSVLQGA